MLEQTIGFIGAGKMATALARGVVKAGVVAEDRVLAADTSADALTAFETAVSSQAQTSSDNAEIAAKSDVLLLAVKPQYMTAALSEVRPGLRPQTLVISIAAGVTLAELAKGLKRGARIVRVMPNTPSLIGRGASGYCLGELATPEDSKLVAKLVTAVGAAFEVTEKQLDAVTGVSGSGPAYVYTAIEALADAGVREGLPRNVAAELAARTVAGAAEMVLETGQHPAMLREAVTSPGGTTAAGLAALDEAGFRWALISAVEAAAKRSQELGAAN